MQGYKKWESRKLQKQVLQTLILAGAAYVCIIGGDNSAWAKDYNGDSLSTSGYGETYDKIDITMENPTKNSYSIYVYGNRNQTVANDRVTVSLSDNGDTYGYNGIFVNGKGQFTAAKGIDFTIDSKGDNNASGEDQAWRYGLRAALGTKIDLGTEEKSIIKINSNAADSYVNGINAYGDSAGTGKEISIKGGDLTININKNNAEQNLAYAAGAYFGAGVKLDLQGTLDMHVEATDGADGLRMEDSDDDNVNSVHVQNLDIYAKTINYSAMGIKATGDNDKITVDSKTNIKLEGKENVYGILIEGDNFEGSFGETAIDVTSTINDDESSYIDHAIGLRQHSGSTEYTSLDIKATGKGAYVTGLELTQQGKVDVNGILEVATTGQGGQVRGVEVASKSSLNITGKAFITANNSNDKGNACGIYAFTGGKLNFAADARVEAITGSKNGTATAVYSRKDGMITFEKGLIANTNGTSALDAEGGTIEVNKAGNNDVQINGNIISTALEGQKSSITVNFDTAQAYLFGNSYTAVDSVNDLKFTNGAYWNLKGSSSVSDLTVGTGSVINMTTDSSRYSNLQVGNLNADNGTFVMNAGKVDGGGSYSDKLIVDKTSSAGTNVIKIISTGGLEDAARNNAVLVKGADTATKFAVSEPVYSGGLYEFDVTLADKENGGKHDWFIGSLRKSTVDSVKTIAAANQVAYTAWVDGNGTLRQRLGELQNGAEQGVWARMFGGKLGGDEFTNKYKTYQLGYDTQVGDWRVGAAYEYSDGSLDYTNGSGKNKIGAVSLYGTLQGKDNSAVDIVIKRGRIYGDMDIYGKYSDNGDYSTDATSIGVEYTKRFDGGSNVYFEPQAQLTFGRIDGYDYVSAKGVRVAYDDINSLIGRLGIVAGKTFDRGDAYVKASVLHEFSGDSSVAMLAANGESYKTDKSYGDTWLEVGIGGNIALGKNCELYGDVERSFGGEVTKNWGANIGFRYNF